MRSDLAVPDVRLQQIRRAADGNLARLDELQSEGHDVDQENPVEPRVSHDKAGQMGFSNSSVRPHEEAVVTIAASPTAVAAIIPRREQFCIKPCFSLGRNSNRPARPAPRRLRPRGPHLARAL